MSEQRLAGKEVPITHAEDDLGPAIIKLFEERGAEIIANTADLTQTERLKLLSCAPEK